MSIPKNVLLFFSTTLFLSSASQAASGTAVPVPPSNAIASANAKGVMTIRWRDNSANESSQQIWVTTDGRNFYRVATLPSNATTFSYSPRPKRPLKYTYRIRALNTAGPSAFAASNAVVLGPTAVASTTKPTPAASPIPVVSSPSPSPSTSPQPSSSDVKAVASVAPFPSPAPNPQAYVINTNSKSVVINPVGDANATFNAVVGYLRNRADKNAIWTVYIMPGDYMLRFPVNADRLTNVIFAGDARNKPHIRKVSPWTGVQGEYAFYFRYCSGIRISGIALHGVLPSSGVREGDGLHYADQGIWLGSSHNMQVDNSEFYDIGNAAIRTNTALGDPKPINSSNTLISDNYFQNVFQITTTSDNATVNGGTTYYTFQRNRIQLLRASVKFCSRQPGAHTAKYLNNVWESSTADAMELCSVDDVEIRGNTFRNIANFLLNAYSNPISNGDWGRGITFADNVIENGNRGIRLSPNKYSNGFQPTMRDVKIDNNHFTTMANISPILSVVNGPIVGMSVTNNQLRDIKRSSYFNLGGVQELTVKNNTSDGVALR